MKVSLIKGLTKDVAAEVTSSFNAGIIFRRQLTKVLNERIETSRKASIKIEEYASPNWGLLQADRVGYERAMRELILLINE